MTRKPSAFSPSYRWHRRHTAGAASLALIALGIGSAPAQPGAADAAFAGGRDFVLFSNNSWQDLSRSTLDGDVGQKLYSAPPGKKVPIQMVDGGNRHVHFESMPGRDDRVTLRDTRSMRVLATQNVPADSDIVGPVFGNPDFYLIRTFAGRTGQASAVVADFIHGKVMGAFATGGAKDTVKSLPDGRLYRINDETGRIAVAGADGAWTTLGALQIPRGRTIGNFEISHRGDRIALYYSVTDSLGVVRGDIWVAGIDGSHQYRLTNQGAMFAPRWSPDDSKIAFQYNNLSNAAGAGLRGAGVGGGCSYWYAPAESQDIAGIAHGRPHPLAREILVNADGVKQSSACHVLSWLR